MINSIKQVKDTLVVVVFTGGEATLYIDELSSVISFCSDNNISTRIVTNGWWASTPEKSDAFVDKLIKMGLSELNTSTGDMHQRFIPLKNIMNMANSCVKYDFSLAINAEYSDSHKFDPFKFQKSDQWINFKQKDIHSKVEILPSPWISLSDEGNYTYNNINITDSNTDLGCEYLFNQIIVHPNRDIMACCGLASNRIEEMNLGNIDNIKLVDAWEKEINDTLKKWLFISGPKNILNTLMNIEPQLKNEISNKIGKAVHQCQFCNILHNDSKAKDALLKYLPRYKQQIDEVFNDKLELIEFTQNYK
ncbi:hypothetical protein RU92_GL001112 [Lactococcus cremoris subsp. tructae]|uniref:Radical SAM protein n=1 Tax=Lactococcus cremoris subsp. tructae TaxID=542833 RepID=A0A2A5SPY3_LACLC|nr:hypothetical protein RU92_GL001112 [Lactococcus cremoris subsp. tructae]